MDKRNETADEQARLWNGTAGCAWVDMQQTLDRMFQPFADLLLEEVAAVGGTHVLDVGCGTGMTTLAIAQQLGAAGQCTGLDISEPMITLARTRAEQEGVPANFIVANAQAHVFEPAGFDMIVSRFGVMFFDDPRQAFSNLRHAARNDAELRCIAWRSAAENPFMTTAERAAAPLLPALPARRPGAPGQFAFADPQLVQDILTESGWTDIAIRPVDAVCTLSEADLSLYLTRLGPVGLLLQSADEQTRAQVIAAVRAAFEPYVHGDEVRFEAACWMISASSRGQEAVRA